MNTPIEWFFVLVVAGIMVTGRLSLYTWRRLSRECLFFPHAGCYLGRQGRYRWTLGIPNAFWGLGVYILLLLLLIGIGQGMSDLEIPFKVIIGIGSAFSLYFTYVQAKILKEFCPWCLASAVACIALAAISLIGF